MSEKPSFEQSMNRLDLIVSQLEKNEVTLQQSIQLFEEGLNLVQDLDFQLQNYENKVEELMLHHQKKEGQNDNHETIL